MSNKAKILILGGGFGGVYAAVRLDKTLARRADVEVTLVSCNNFLLFTPMLHEVAAGDLNPSNIVNPIRRMLNTMLNALSSDQDLFVAELSLAQTSLTSCCHWFSSTKLLGEDRTSEIRSRQLPKERLHRCC